MDSLWRPLTVRFFLGSAAAVSKVDPINYVLLEALGICIAGGFFYRSKFVSNTGMKVYETRTFTNLEQYIIIFLQESIPFNTLSGILAGIDRTLLFML
jgi:hypothetical protein